MAVLDKMPRSQACDTTGCVPNTEAPRRDASFVVSDLLTKTARAALEVLGGPVVSSVDHWETGLSKSNDQLVVIVARVSDPVEASAMIRAARAIAHDP